MYRFHHRKKYISPKCTVITDYHRAKEHMMVCDRNCAIRKAFNFFEDPEWTVNPPPNSKEVKQILTIVPLFYLLES